MASPTGNTNPLSLARRGFQSTAGIALIVFGVIILADQYLKTGWLSLLVLPAAGVIFLVGGIRRRKIGLIIPGGILLGSGTGILAVLNPLVQANFQPRVSAFFFVFAFGWVAIGLAGRRVAQDAMTWTYISAGVLAAMSLLLWLIPWTLVDLSIFLPTSIGLILLICVLLYRKFGLIIPGCLVITISPGVFFAWGLPIETNNLAKAGTMLVTFALGWGLITVFSRVITEQFIWWPLIPGGVLAMVGWGLYLAGNPNQALSFIGNTGSVGLIIFGVYLLLWRNSLRR
jgi:hypothetical protein